MLSGTATTHSFACGLFCFVLAVATCAALPPRRRWPPELLRQHVPNAPPHRSNVALSVDNGMDTRIVLRSDEQQPLASAAKVVHLAAYGRAVAQRLVRADDLVRVGDWERWHLPGSDGGAHPRALNRAGVANDGIRAVDPQRTVTLDTIVSSMIQESDNAAADFLHDRLGDQALIRAAAEASGPAPSCPPSSVKCLPSSLPNWHRSQERGPEPSGRLRSWI
jgi:D-alanyl-D-alanine carboxypeptidase